MLLEIKKYPNEALRKKSENIIELNDDIKKLIKNMAETMYDAPGIGLAAPQVGINKRLIVLDITEEKHELMALINPEISICEGEQIGEEGCLSVPGEYANVKRYMKLQVKALNEDFEEINFEAEGLLARVIQHEIDHLNGKLFIDQIPAIKRESIKKHIKKRIAAGDYK